MEGPRRLPGGLTGQETDEPVMAMFPRRHPCETVYIGQASNNMHDLFQCSSGKCVTEAMNIYLNLTEEHINSTATAKMKQRVQKTTPKKNPANPCKPKDGQNLNLNSIHLTPHGEDQSTGADWAYHLLKRMQS